MWPMTNSSSVCVWYSDIWCTVLSEILQIVLKQKTVSKSEAFTVIYLPNPSISISTAEYSTDSRCEPMTSQRSMLTSIPVSVSCIFHLPNYKQFVHFLRPYTGVWWALTFPLCCIKFKAGVILSVWTQATRPGYTNEQSHNCIPGTSVGKVWSPWTTQCPGEWGRSSPIATSSSF